MHAKHLGILLMVMLMALLLHGCASLPPVRTENPMEEDLYVLATNLPDVHADFFHDSTRKELRKLYDQVAREIGSLDDTDFYFALSKITAFAHDSHTAVGITPELAAHFHVIPMNLSFIDGAWRILAIDADRRNLLGAQVLAVGGMPMERIIGLARVLVGHDNEVWLYHSVARLLHLSEFYSYLGASEDPLANISLTVVPYGSTEPVAVKFVPRSSATISAMQFATLYDVVPPTGISTLPYRYLTLDSHDALFIQYNVCASVPGYPLSDFIDEVLATIRRDAPKRVIVDLRYNGGGDSRLFEPMVDGLARLQQEMGFPLDVLIGEGTFSSAVMNAIHFTRRTACRLVGSPTGGSVNHYGEVASFELPNSKLPVMYSTRHFVMDPSHAPGPLIPHVSAGKSVADLLAGKDTVIGHILGATTEISGTP